MADAHSPVPLSGRVHPAGERARVNAQNMHASLACALLIPLSMRLSKPAAYAGKNAAFCAVLAASRSIASCLTLAFLTVLCSGRSFASAEQRSVHNRVATMHVSATVPARCEVNMRPQLGAQDLLSSFDVSCQGAPNVRIEKDPTLHTLEDGRTYIVTIVLL
jgi:hypothetical protein